MGCCAACDGTGYVAGQGPDYTQAQRARGQVPAGLFNDVVGQSPERPGARAAKADYPPLHEFRERVVITTATQLNSSSSNDTGVAALPGRYPAAGWDGEPGAMSPIADRGGM